MNQFIVIHSPEQNIKYEEHSVGDRTPSETLLELLLKVHRKPGSILCGCQFQNGQSLLLKFVRYGDKSRRRYRLDRRHKSDNHADDCFSRMPDSQQSRTDNPTSLGLSAATFALLTQAPAKSPPPQNRPNPEREAERRTPRATFARFTTDILRSGFIEAWKASVVTWQTESDFVAGPTADHYLRGINTALNSPGEGGHPSAIQCAQGMGLRLIHGICQSRIPIKPELHSVTSATPLLLSCYHNIDNRAAIQVERFSASHYVLTQAAKRLHQLNGWMEPPYYFFGVVNAKNELHRLALLPVFFEFDNLVFVDSAFERNVTAALLRNKLCSLKPPLKGIISDLAPLHPRLAWFATLDARYLPDFIICWGRKNVVLEVQGFSAKPAYNRHLNIKSAIFSAQPRSYRYFVIKVQRFRPREPAVEISTTPKVDFYFQDRS